MDYTGDFIVKKWGDSWVIMLNKDSRRVLDAKEGTVLHVTLTRKPD